MIFTMKKTIYLIMLIILTFTVACNTTITIPDGVEHPSYANANKVKGSYRHGSIFGDGDLLCPECEMIIADVTINGWLDECVDYSGSYYSADVNHVIYGDIEAERIVVALFGTTDIMPSEKVFPPFEQGERLILFATKTQDYAMVSEEQWQNEKGVGLPNWMKVGLVYEANTYCNVIEDEEDELYVADFTYTLTQLVKDRAVDLSKKNEVLSTLFNNYPNKSDMTYYEVFTYNEFISLINEYAPKD